MKSIFTRPCLLPAILMFAFSCLLGPAWGENPDHSLEESGAARSSPQAPPVSSAAATIPGPLNSFLRMAGISQKASPEEVFPLLAHQVVTNGYEYRGRKGKIRNPTEFLKLLEDYVEQASELQRLAGPDGVIRVVNCSQVQPLLEVLGYRLTEACGPNTSVEVADSKRAFLTADSGFPLADCTHALRTSEPFTYPFPSTRVPVVFTPGDWMGKDSHGRDDLLDVLLRDPERARLYWSLSQIDASTRNFLRRSPGLEKLLPFAPVLDFYGSQILIRSGRVVVPGGAAAEAAWKNLVGSSPASPAEFIMSLLRKDEGWLAAYFDALSRVNPPQQAYFTNQQRLGRFYKALRGRNPSPGPAQHAYRPDPNLLLLMTRLQVDSESRPHIPGNLAVWGKILRASDVPKEVREWGDRAVHWTGPDDLVEALVAVSRMYSPAGPLQAFLELSEIDRERSRHRSLSPQAVRLLAEKFPRFGDQYLVFSEFYPLSDSSITSFLDGAEALDRIRDPGVRTEAVGIFQANVGLWQILARQGQIPESDWNRSWQLTIRPFMGLRSSPQLLDAARKSLESLFQAAAGNSRLSQDQLIALLAGPRQTNPAGQRVKRQEADRIRAILDAQRLISLDTLFALGDGLMEMAEGRKSSESLLPLAGELREFRPPEPLFTQGERARWSSGFYRSFHIQSEMGTDLPKIIQSGRSRRKLASARGELVPFLRDILVGLNYAYYEPPGAQMIYSNALFVRSHDFSGESVRAYDRSWRTPDLFGRGIAASGGAHLVGSLANLPYVLAEVEQNFIVPENVQALIWEGVVPSLLVDAVVPRWWHVTPEELHAATLYQRCGEDILRASGKDGGLREKVMGILSGRLLPERSERVEEALRENLPDAALAQLAPADTFYLASQFRQRFPDAAAQEGSAGQELDKLAQRYPNQVSEQRLSEDFGVPHPALARTYARSLLNVKPLPTFLGYSSRLLAESWESNNLYWARLADEKGYPPVMLNVLAPELTHRMVERIFATYLADWPALLRALRETGEEFRQASMDPQPNGGTASPQQGLDSGDSDR